MGIVWLLLGALPVSLVRGDVFSLNESFDAVLLGVRSGIRGSGRSYVPVPDFREAFKYRFLLVQFRSFVSCWDGRVGDLSDMAREGDMSVLEVNYGPAEKTVTLDIRIRIEKLQVFYPRCQVEIKGLLKQTKTTYLEIAERTLWGKLVLTVNGNSSNCLARLEYLRMDEASHASIISSGLVAAAKKNVVDIMLDHFNRDARGLVTSYIDEYLRQYLSQSSICDKIK